FSHDLHVLGTPPAFVLSQDQTLQFDVACRSDPKPRAGAAFSSRIEHWSCFSSWPRSRADLFVWGVLGPGTPARPRGTRGGARPLGGIDPGRRSSATRLVHSPLDDASHPARRD